MGEQLIKAIRSNSIQRAQDEILRTEDINFRDQDGNTAICIACKKMNDEMVALLLENGSDPNTLDSRGKSVLRMAAGAGLFHMVELLTQAGADVNLRSHGGITPLMAAVMTNRTEIVQFLLAEGAHPNILDDKGDSALDFARRWRRLEIVALLEGVEFEDYGKVEETPESPEPPQEEHNLGEPLETAVPSDPISVICDLDLPEEHEDSPNIPLLAMPYEDRKYIVVIPDEVLEVIHEENFEKSSHLFGFLTLPDYLKSWGITEKIYGTVKGIFEGEIKDDETIFKPITMSESQHLVFPVGHPRYDRLYVGHPYYSTNYYPLESFHKKLFEQKVCEAMDILRHLGASSISVKYHNGWRKEIAAEMGLNEGPGPSSYGAELGYHNNINEDMIFQQNLEGHNDPKLPAQLKWYYDEPTWQSIAEARLNHGLKDFHLAVKYEDDLGVNSEIAMKVEAFGIGIGGNVHGEYKIFQATHWELIGSFNCSE
jgi:hypothetical protein